MVDGDRNPRYGGTSNRSRLRLTASTGFPPDHASNELFDERETSMTVSEIERTELAAHLVNAIGKEPTETLMKGLLLEGKDRLATKDDLKILGTELRAEMVALRGYVDSALSKHARLYFIITAGFMLTIWGTLLALFVT